MEGHQFRYQIIGLIDLDIQNSFVIHGFSLNHFSMVDSDSKKYRVHNLSNNELNNLIGKTFGQNGYCEDPREHVNCVCNDKVS